MHKTLESWCSKNLNNREQYTAYSKLYSYESLVEDTTNFYVLSTYSRFMKKAAMYYACILDLPRNVA